MRQRQSLQIPNRTGQHRPGPNRNQVSVNSQPGQHYAGWRSRGRWHPAWIEDIEPMRAAKIHDAALIHKTGLSIELLALEAIALVVVGEAAIPWIKPRKATVRAQPQIPFPV